MATDLRSSDSAALTAVKLADGKVQVTAGCQSYTLDADDLRIIAEAVATPTYSSHWSSGSANIMQDAGSFDKIEPHEVAVFVCNATPEWLAAHNLAVNPTNDKHGCSPGQIARRIFDRTTGKCVGYGHSNYYVLTTKKES